VLRLRILRLRIGMGLRDHTRRYMPPRFHLWVHNVVSGLRISSTVQEISIKSSLRSEIDERRCWPFSMIGWMPVDEVLTTIPSLRRVTFFVSSDEIDLSLHVPRMFDEEFQGLTSRGILSVKAADTRTGFLETADDFPQEIR